MVNGQQTKGQILQQIAREAREGKFGRGTKSDLRIRAGREAIRRLQASGIRVGDAIDITTKFFKGRDIRPGKQRPSVRRAKRIERERKIERRGERIQFQQQLEQRARQQPTPTRATPKVEQPTPTTALTTGAVVDRREKERKQQVSPIAQPPSRGKQIITGIAGGAFAFGQTIKTFAFSTGRGFVKLQQAQFQPVRRGLKKEGLKLEKPAIPTILRGLPSAQAPSGPLLADPDVQTFLAAGTLGSLGAAGAAGRIGVSVFGLGVTGVGAKQRIQTPLPTDLQTKEVTKRITETIFEGVTLELVVVVLVVLVVVEIVCALPVVLFFFLVQYVWHV